MSGGAASARTRWWGTSRIALARIEESAALREVRPAESESFMILFVERGGGRLLVSGIESATAAGDLYAVAPDDALDGRHLGGTRGWVLSFMPDALLPDSAATPGYMPLPGDPRWLAIVRNTTRGQRRRVVPVADRPRWDRRFAEIRDELAGRRFGYQQAVRAELALLLVDVARLTLPDARTTALAPSRIQQTIEVVDAHYADDLSVGAVAEAVASSPSQLERLVKRATGRSVRRLIEERRMQEARRLLLETETTVDAIATSVGYRDAKYFRRRFRHIHDLPPQRWRELHR